MRSRLRVLFYLRKNSLNKRGEAAIMVRITVNSERAQFSSNLSVIPEQWDIKAGTVQGNTAEVHRLNGTLDNIRAAIINHYNEIERFGEIATAEKVKNTFLGVKTGKLTLLELFAKHLEDTKALVGINKSKATFQKYSVTFKRLQNFLKYKYKLSDINLHEVNHMFLVDFENYLRTICDCNANTTSKFMQFFKRIIIMAKNNGWIQADPFANYKIRLQKVDRGYLTETELNAIMEKEFAIKRLEQVRDIFIFSCFTGLAYIDVKNLNKDKIRTTFNGETWIISKRKKTNVTANIPLLEVPRMILEKYKGTLPDRQVLPVISNQKMNSYLKEIADMCVIGKNLTFHLARHTFATTVTLSKGVPIESVSKMLGHTNIRTTQIYARITNEKLGNDMKQLASKLESSNLLNLQL